MRSDLTRVSSRVSPNLTGSNFKNVAGMTTVREYFSNTFAPVEIDFPPESRLIRPGIWIQPPELINCDNKSTFESERQIYRVEDSRVLSGLRIFTSWNVFIDSIYDAHIHFFQGWKKRGQAGGLTVNDEKTMCRLQDKAVCPDCSFVLRHSRHQWTSQSLLQEHSLL